MVEATKIELQIKEDLNKLLIKLKDVPEFKYLRGISSAYDEGEQKYIDVGLKDSNGNTDYQLVGLVMLKELIERIQKGQLGVYDNDMLNSYFVSDDEMGEAETFDKYGRY